MWKAHSAAAFLLIVARLFSWKAAAALFGGYECTKDCSGHAAGYDWAEEHGIDDPDT